VADHGRTRDERGKPASDRLERGSTTENLIADPREARHRGPDLDAGSDERAEALAERDGTVVLDTKTHRADLDDAVRLRVEPGGLDVERDELQRCAVLAAALPRSD
jgi:hypothetical protein